MQWLRLWVDAIDDEKLKLLAFEDRWHYIAILCMKRKGMLDVKEPEPLRDRKVGVKLGLGDRERDEARRRLIDVNLIDEQWQPKAWDKRQYVSDADPTALERKHRQRLKQRHGRVTRDKSVRHGSVTDGSRLGHTAQSQSQSQIQTTDTDKNQEPGSVELKLDRGPAERIFEHWRSEFRHPRAALDPKRRRAIQRSLEAYDEDTLKAAISGYKLSPHHMGQNDQRAVYDDLSLFLRDAEHIDRGLNFSRAPPVAARSAVEIARENLRKQSNGSESRVVSEQTGRPGDSGLGSVTRMLR